MCNKLKIDKLCTHSRVSVCDRNKVNTWMILVINVVIQFTILHFILAVCVFMSCCYFFSRLLLFLYKLFQLELCDQSKLTRCLTILGRLMSYCLQVSSLCGFISFHISSIFFFSILAFFSRFLHGLCDTITI